MNLLLAEPEGGKPLVTNVKMCVEVGDSVCGYKISRISTNQKEEVDHGI